MPEDFKYQLSIKLGPNGQDMLNIRANDWNEFSQALDNAVFGSAKIASVGDTVRAVPNVPGQVVETTVAPPAQPHYQPPAAPAAPAEPQGDPNTTCKHGNRVYRTGQSSKGQWAAWFCPAQKGDPTQCEPKWVGR